MDIAQLLKSALAEHRAGNLSVARKNYGLVLDQDPDNVDALHLLGVLESQAGERAAAIALITRALEINPAFAEALNSLGNVFKENGEWAEAGASYERAVDLDPQFAGAYLNLGYVARRTGDLDGALAAYESALEIDPTFAPAHFNLANLLSDQNRLEEAIASYRLALANDPDFREAKINLGETLAVHGNALLEAADWPAAVEVLTDALVYAPGNAATHNNLGNALRNLGEVEEAIEHYGRALALDPDYAAVHNNLGNVWEDIGEPSRAIESYEAALAIDPKFAAAHNNLGNALRALDRVEAAIASYHRALAIDPQFLGAHFNLGHAHKELADVDQATACYRRVLEIEPTHAGAHRHLASLGALQAGEAGLETMQRALEEVDGENPDGAELAFALAKAFEDRGEFDRAFTLYVDANTRHRRTFTYDVDEDGALFCRLGSVFTSELMTRHGGGGETDSAPIFIVGMPRSGTSLVEQILASHPKVYGAGELMALPEIAHNLSLPPGSGSYPEIVESLGADERRELGQRYLSHVRARIPTSGWFTDKLPLNFIHLGLIKLILPNARIVHCRRAPEDTCLSLYRTLFADRLDFAYDLKELATYYGYYLDLMDHWRQVLPGGFFELHYEELIADQEIQTRRLLEYVGLPWNEACLKFHLTKRRVATASNIQVRQKMYTGSIGAWRKYERQLAPLLAALPNR